MTTAHRTRPTSYASRDRADHDPAPHPLISTTQGARRMSSRRGAPRDLAKLGLRTRAELELWAYQPRRLD